MDKLDPMTLPLKISSIDRLGAGVSFVCAIHYAIVRFAATILPLSVSVAWLANASNALFSSVLWHWQVRAFAGESAFTVSAASWLSSERRYLSSWPAADTRKTL